MDNFFSLFRRYLNDKAKGSTVYVDATLVKLIFTLTYETNEY